MVEYDSRDNRFPFAAKQSTVSICRDNNEDLYEYDFIYNKIVEKFPELAAEKFYSKVQEIERMRPSFRVAKLKDASDALLRNIKVCLMDEAFVHQLHERWGFGIDKLIQTIYAVYGYYFYTGKRTANIVKKILDGYKRQPVH